MLSGAQRLKGEGLDVVLGLIETHGRAETLALVDGVEALPRRKIAYHGREIEEFDLEAALIRNPKLIVVDELAHTNAPESRHPKRWQDVQDLLAAGIDVWTALNVQHLESLADVVSRITGVSVRETVPDKVLQEADDVVLVDITPDELITRLREGKIYLPETARRASENFFTPVNLTALRELALRRTADRVDDQMDALLKQKAIEEPWGASEKLLACVGYNEFSEQVVRRTAQLATSLHASWIALHVSPLGCAPDANQAHRLSTLFALVERLGGQKMQVKAQDCPAEILRVARRENVTQILLGEVRTNVLARILRPSLSAALMRACGDIEIHIISAGERPTRRRFDLKTWLIRPYWTGDFLLAAPLTLTAAIIGDVLSNLFPLPNGSILFLAAVLFCALLRGTRAAILSSIFSFFAYRYTFIAPYHTFATVYNLSSTQPYELFSLSTFLFMSMLVGALTERMRDQHERSLRTVAATQSLYEFSDKLSRVSGLDDVCWTTAAHLHATLGGRIVLLTMARETLKIQAAWPPDTELDTAEEAAAHWALQHREPAGWGTGTLPNIAFQFRPLVASNEVIAVCGFEIRSPQKPDLANLLQESEHALTAILDQATLALDRAELAGEAIKAAALAENEKVRTLLLDSLSHDLRTPLATIAGAVSTLRDLGGNLNGAEACTLIQSIDEETARLTRFVTNLIDMSRIEAGGLKVARDWVDMADAIASAVERSRKAFPSCPIKISIAPDLPLVRGDTRLIEQILFNLIDNAHKYASDSGIAIHARREEDMVILSVTDEGPGIKPQDLTRVFEKFYRGGRVDGRMAGAGLGLSICRGLVEAMCGTIEAQSPAIRRRGTRILVRLPAADKKRS